MGGQGFRQHRAAKRRKPFQDSSGQEAPGYPGAYENPGQGRRVRAKGRPCPAPCAICDDGAICDAERLYLALDVRRVYYSAYVPTGVDPRLPVLGKPPLGREHRLYQADWLFRFYGFSSSEILDGAHPFLEENIDPKSNWALRNLQLFPLELKTAEYAQLLRVPGIGPKSASRIVAARGASRLTLETLARLGVVMRRAKWFISLGGVLAFRNDPDSSNAPGRLLERPEFLRDQLLDPAFRRRDEAAAKAQPDLPWTAD
ncbi:MAG: radical SAM family protein [Spirochaetes bacterium]|nr:MAG: radical SAM family protein [Spirochaetota bacterium]